MIRLGQTDDGRLLMACNHKLPSDIERVEYFRDLKLFMLVYEGEENGDELMPCEMDDEAAKVITASPDVIIVVMAQPNEEPYEYIAPLVQIGV